MPGGGEPEENGPESFSKIKGQEERRRGEEAAVREQDTGLETRDVPILGDTRGWVLGQVCTFHVGWEAGWDHGRAGRG